MSRVSSLAKAAMTVTLLAFSQGGAFAENEALDETETSAFLELREKRDQIVVAFGSFEVFDGSDFAVSFEYRFGIDDFPVHPLLGARRVPGEASYIYGGFYLDLPLSSRFVLTPSLSGGIYDEQGGKDLGGPVQFKSSIELSTRLGDRVRLGLTFDHLSNAGIYERNSGTETLSLSLIVELGEGN